MVLSRIIHHTWAPGLSGPSSVAAESRLAGTPVVVTGSQGFIGGHLLEALVRLGADVTGVDRRRMSRIDGSRSLVADLASNSMEVDVRNALCGAEVVFHLAARPGVRDEGPEVARARFRDNVLATQVVAQLVLRDALLVVTSSSSVYGGLASMSECNREDDELRPRGGYARTKAEAERVCAARAAKGGRVAVVRPFTVAGERQRPDMAIASWLAQAKRGEPLRVLGALDRFRDVTDVRDVVKALMIIAECGIEETVNIGTGVAWTLRELATTVAEVMGVPTEFELARSHPDEVEGTRACTERCQELLKFVPETHLKDLVRRQAEVAPSG